MVKFLQYHPINEFEPFLESLGLKQSQVSQLLPHNLMFLCDNPLLVENVRTLCDYGIPRSYVGKMYTEEREIFGYEKGVLGSKLLAYEDNRALAQVTVFFFSGDGGQVAGLRGGDDGTATEQRRRRSCRDGRRVIDCVRIVWFFFRSRRQSAAVASPTMPDGRRRTMAASGDGCDGDLGSNRTPGDGCDGDMGSGKSWPTGFTNPSASVVKLVAASPSLLTEDVKGEFVKVLGELKYLGIESDWITGQLSENNTYDWSRMLRVLHFFGEMGYSTEELGGLFISHPELLLDGSGDTDFSLIALLLKLGFARNEIITLFLQFPEVIIVDFIENMKQGLAFLIEIGMETKQIVKIVHSHLQILGSCSFKRPNSVLVKLNVGKQRLCGIIKEDPNQLKNWVFGSKISPLPKPSRDPRLMQKTAFLVTLGFTEGSDEMKNALKLFQGSSVELQERFDCLVRAGLKPTDVSNMIKAAPQVLSQSRDTLQKKIDFFVNSLGFPLESLLEFPRYMSYTIERVKLRFLMYKWLKDQEKVIPTLALSTILVCSEKVFALQYVNCHPKGPEV
ncbi:hypothetical protein MRB53_032803 [Persea americana]|uniref:Uncharacterized protein n=1 Tax=Persea americana TaxID=3435 RepID=A0ACC2KT40_PERAE|nr:hypothetical protein MRB53_032803 [Persea americana]